MSNILKLQGLKAESSNALFFTSGFSTSLHMRAEQPVAAK